MRRSLVASASLTLTSALFVAGMLGAAPAGATPTVTFYTHAPAGRVDSGGDIGRALGCVPDPTTSSDRLITCEVGLDTNPPTETSEAWLDLSSTDSDDASRTVMFKFVSAALNPGFILGAGGAVAPVWMRASGTPGLSVGPVDITVKLLKKVGMTETLLASGTLTGQTLIRGTVGDPNWTQFDVPYSITAPLVDRIFNPGDQVVFVVQGKNQTAVPFRQFVGFDSTGVDTNTGVGVPLPVACEEVGGGQPDGDGDLIPDNCDNCPNIPNSNQDDTNNDTIGDVCQCLDPTLPGECVPGGGALATDCNAEFLQIGLSLL
jgi:hypothetical protein